MFQRTRARSLVFLLASSLSASLSSAGQGKPTLDNPFQQALKKLPQDPCVSLFTRNDRIGCGTKSREHMTGNLLEWSTLVNSNYYSSGDIANSLPDFIAVIDEYEFNYETVTQIKATASSSSSSQLQGIIVLNHTSSSSASLSYASPAPIYPRGQDTPSEELTPDYDYAWNNNGDGLMLENLYGVPIVYVSDEDIAEYICTASREQAADIITELSNEKKSIFDENARKFPPIMATFNMYMGPEEMNSKSCLAWEDADGVWSPKCLPLGGTSVWALAGSPYERSNYDSDNDGNRRRVEDEGQKKKIVMVATNVDATSMFHDKANGANTAASNILTVLMAAKLFGESIPDADLDALENKVMFSFFEGENYGYIGSRSFLRDVVYPGFQCDSSPVAAKAKDKDSDNAKMACMSPMRHELDFMDLGTIKSMIAVDQVGILSNENTLYVHDSSGNDDAYYSGPAMNMEANDFTITAAEAGSLPPTPLSSLFKLSDGGIGGIVIAGYDDAFAAKSYYLSHLDSSERVSIDLDAIAAAATLVARTALATAYGDDYYSYDVADKIAALASDDETLTDLANCLLVDGNCKLFQKYASMEKLNNKDEYGTDLGLGQSLGKPPNYYPGVYNSRNGQPFVQIDGVSYGAYTGEKEYGSDKNDKFMIRPDRFSMSLLGLLNDYLGRGGTDSDGNAPDFHSCQGTSDCSTITYCPSEGDRGVCTGSKVCVCSRAHYHIALDEAITPSSNNGTSVFKVSENDDGTSPMYTEPYWGNDIGVHIFRAANGAADWTLAIGLVTTFGCVGITILLNRRLRKEKLY